MGPCGQLQVRTVRDRIRRSSENRPDPEGHQGSQCALTRPVQASHHQAHWSTLTADTPLEAECLTLYSVISVFCCTLLLHHTVCCLSVLLSVLPVRSRPDCVCQECVERKLEELLPEDPGAREPPANLVELDRVQEAALLEAIRYKVEPIQAVHAVLSRSAGQ